MTKKEYLSKVLVKLEPVRDLASGLKFLVEQGAMGDDILDVLIGAVESGIHSAKMEVAKLKMKKGLDVLTRMKRIEQQSAMKDQRELTELDNLIDDF